MNLTNFITTISTGANNTSFASITQIVVITGLIATILLIGFFVHKLQIKNYEK